MSEINGKDILDRTHANVFSAADLYGVVIRVGAIVGVTGIAVNFGPRKPGIHEIVLLPKSKVVELRDALTKLIDEANLIDPGRSQ